MTKTNAFVKQFVAIVKGDDAEAQALKAWRGAEASLKVHIAQNDADRVAKESDVESAEDYLVKARVNFGREFDTSNAPAARATYINSLIEAQNSLKKAEKALVKHDEMKEFMQGQYDLLKTMVEKDVVEAIKK